MDYRQFQYKKMLDNERSDIDDRFLTIAKFRESRSMKFDEMSKENETYLMDYKEHNYQRL